ncbi:GH39 family glycosyl hydrolase [Miltoncostaea marina]|uniref:GH39 family glycosyl hydrolase n=1 Tax=Miltoncostaea marina TaxID=2843215 RepID=UPI001C3C93D4|nr:hypothetical protein [Miltoncostaea marina]
MPAHTPRRALAPAIALAAALAAPLAAPSDARAVVLGVQDDRLSSGPVADVPKRMALIDATNARVTRQDVLWSLVAPTRPARPTDPGDPAYDWSRIDAAMQGFERLGLTPILVAYSAPPWAANGRPIPQGTQVNPAAPRPRHYADFMEALARRYSGSYTPQGASGPLPRARHFEIWNEPNLGAFLSPQVSGGRRVAVTRYVAMARAGHAAIKRVNRSAIVIAGVGGPRSSTGANGTGALEWARRIARSAAPFDAYSQHVYPAAAPLANTRAFPAWGTLPQLFDALDAVPRRRGTPVYLTEIGYTTAATEYRDVRVSRGQQAAYLRQIMALPQVRSGRVRAMIWFNMQDNPNWPGGIFDLAGRRKPSFAVFQRLARAGALTPDLRVRPPVTLSRRQLLINQRISQAAVRRLNLVQRRLDAGLTTADLRPGGMAPPAFGQGVATSFAAGAGPVAAPPLTRAAEVPDAPRRRPGAAARVRLAAAQLLINQRVSQAAVRRANGIERRFAGGLTGGDLRPGAIDASRLAPGLTIDVAVPVATRPGPSRTVVAPAARRPGARVSLSAAQLRVNQRIAQAGVRRANALSERLAEGFAARDFRPQSVTAISIAPALRTPG